VKNRILDYGCGSGYRSVPLRRYGEYWGVDIDPKNIESAKRSFPDANFTVIDGKSMLFQDGYFDEVHVYDVLEHVEQVEPVLKEISRCLKKNGMLIIEVPSESAEKCLLKIRPNYWKESGHLRMIGDKEIRGYLCKLGYLLHKQQKKRGIDSFVLAYYFLTGRGISSHTGDVVKENPILKRIAYLFSEDLFSTIFFRRLLILWIIFPIWIITQPLGWLLSSYFPKSKRYELIKD